MLGLVEARDQIATLAVDCSDTVGKTERDSNGSALAGCCHHQDFGRGQCVGGEMLAPARSDFG